MILTRTLISLTNFSKINCVKQIPRILFSHQAVPSSNCNNNNVPEYVYFHENFEDSLKTSILKDMLIINDFLTLEEEQSIFNEIEPYLKRLRYEFDHWDDAIHGYRETERLKWNEDNMKILQRVRDLAFPPKTAQLKHVHVLDLDAKGVIKPHIDSVRFCGNTITGMSLLSDSVMRLVHHQKLDQKVDFLLKQRSLYIMKDEARFDYTHEILGTNDSFYKGVSIPRHRRISVICRNEPNQEK